MDQVTWVLELDVETEESPPEGELIEMAKEADQWDWSVSARADGPGVHIRVYMDEQDNDLPPFISAEHYFPEVERWAQKHLPAASTVSYRIVTEEQVEREADRPTLPELVGAADAAEMLGISRQRVHQLAAAHPNFPNPVVRLRDTSIWTKPALEAFAAVWERRPGRPRLIREA